MANWPDQSDAMAPILCPFTVVIDSREQAPFSFEQMRADAADEYRPITVPTITRGLKSGDYSIAELEERVAIERKSLSDLYGTLGQGRERFVRELERLNELDFAAVVCEGSWRDIIYHPPEHSRMNPKAVMRSILAFCVRYPKVHWFPMGSRRVAEATCFRLLDRFWRDAQEAAA